MPVFTQTSRIPVSAGVLYDWHLRPGALERLIPPWERARVLARSGPLAEGSRVTLEIRKALRRYVWEARHRDFVPGRQFRHEQVRGPFQRWVHTHTVNPDGPAACRLTDEIDYELPLAGLGRVLLGGRIARDLRRAFRFRHERTRADVTRHMGFPGRPLRIVISGASGLVGAALCAFLAGGGHRVDRLVRRAGATAANDFGGKDAAWNPARGEIDPATLAGCDAVVHLSGENLAGGRWTPEYKERIRRSRIDSTLLLARTLAALPSPPRTMICASATGYYGPHGDEPQDERAPGGSGFLADVCRAWEAAAEPARAAGIRVVHARLGVVLSGNGGALSKMLTPFRLGFGAVLGTGRQRLSWISLSDVVYALHHLLGLPALEGPLNLCAPEAPTNREFTTTLARVLQRPALARIPSAVIRLGLGEMGQACLLEGVRATPRALAESGYEFAYPDLETALRSELGRHPDA
jgi:uncharacterized protein (TIGR01777 family)